MGQLAKYVDYDSVLKPLKDYVGKTVLLYPCVSYTLKGNKKVAHKPTVVLVGAAYESVSGVRHKGMFDRVQIYCDESGCSHGQFQPIEASTLAKAMKAWNEQHSPPNSIQFITNTSKVRVRIKSYHRWEERKKK